jgi:hypothetical protein
MWDGYIFGRPGAYAEYFNDFFQWVPGDWVITTLEAGAGSATEAITDEVGGVLLLTMAAGDNDSDDIQLTGESFLAAAGKTIFLEGRLKISDTGDSDFFFGLADTDTTLIDGVSDGVYFKSDDGDDNLDCACAVGSVISTQNTIATLADDTYVKLGFKITGTTKAEFWVNDVKTATIESNIPTAETALSFAIQNGSAAARTMSIDYIFAAQER